MYRRPKSLEVLDEIRIEMAREADFDADLFAENVRSGYVRSEKAEERKTPAKPSKQRSLTVKETK
ncbi:MAG: hypothetical protein IPM50_05555 [Acidobacteriota bacterium]|nr:MAG: hypothetical protein IPM50_05555 [Acidobacteriota bacterium]